MKLGTRRRQPVLHRVSRVQGDRRVTRRTLLIGLLIAIVAACTQSDPDRPTGGDTGFRGGMLTGIVPEIGGALSDGGTFAFEDSPPGDAAVNVVLDVQDTSCGDAQDTRPCPAPDVARMTFVVSALLNLREVVMLDGQESVTVVHRGAAKAEHRLSMQLPNLPAGRHCLLLAVIEEPFAAVRDQLADHSTAAAVQVNVGGARWNHCKGMAEADATAPGGTVGVDPCGLAVLGPSPAGLEIVRRAEPGAKLFATVGDCGARSSGVYIRNSRLVAEGAFAAFTLSGPSARQSGDLRVNEVPVVEDGTLQLAVVHDSAPEPILVLLSQPVVVDG